MLFKDSVFHRHGSLRVQNYEHPDIEGLGVVRWIRRADAILLRKVEFARELEHQAQEQQGLGWYSDTACQSSASFWWFTSPCVKEVLVGTGFLRTMDRNWIGIKQQWKRSKTWTLLRGKGQFLRNYWKEHIYKAPWHAGGTASGHFRDLMVRSC